MRPLLALAVVAGAAACATPPAGTPQRPQLDARGAERYDIERVLGTAGRGRAPRRDGWNPLAQARAPAALHYRVDAAARGAAFATVQAAVNQAHVDALAGRHAGTTPLVIGIAPGRYAETVYVPAGPRPLALVGLGDRPEDVRIELALSAGTPRDDYRRQLAPVYESARTHADVAAMFRACAAGTAPTIGTSCSAVMAVANDGFELRNLTLANGHEPQRSTSGAHQAVAFKSEGADRLRLEQVHLLGHQDTLYLRSKGDDHIARTFVHRSLIEGDVDFIFGAGTAYLLDSEIRWVGTRRGHAGGYVGAPSTSLHVPYGFVFERCRFTSAAPGGGVALARQWFAGARCSPYGETAGRCRIDPTNAASDANTLPQVTLEAVGKMVVLNSALGSHLLRDAPWSPWQADRRAPNHRPVQLDSDAFWHHLEAGGIDPQALGYRRRVPAEPFLAEYRNRVD